MKLIKPSFEIYEQGPGLDGIYEAIERAGRTCYKSKRPEGKTAKDFVGRLITSKHLAVLEHGTVYLSIPTDEHSIGAYHHNGTILASQFDDIPYAMVHYAVEYDPDESSDIAYVTTNLRVLYEYFDEEEREFIINKYLCEPTKYHEKRVTVRFTTDRGVSHEFVRHRVFSFAQESTRYCNYSKDKFGGELTFIEPSWDMTLKPSDYGEDRSLPFLLSNIEIEYNHLINDCGWKPQQARMILPNCIKTELVMTGFTSDWNHFFRLRTSILAETGKPHPDASALADPLYKEFIDRGYMESLV